MDGLAYDRVAGRDDPGLCNGIVGGAVDRIVGQRCSAFRPVALPAIINYGDLGFDLPFEYKSAFLPLVAIWYIVTELGSIIENAARLGATVPKFLISSLKKLKDKADEDK